MFEKSFRIICLIFLLAFASKFCEKKTEGFTLWRISSNRPYNEEFATETREGEELQKALAQPYSYFRRGGQAHVFLSEDGQYVIKFLKQKMFRPPFLLNHLPLPFFLHRFREKLNWKRRDKLWRDFTSYKFAFEELREQTGIVYLHLNPTSHLQTKLTIIDRLNISHKIDLDRFNFIVQKRAEEVNYHIASLMNQNKVTEAKRAIEDLIALIKLSEKKGFRDRDPDIQTNCGFIGNRAIKVDIGRFLKGGIPYTKAEQEKILAPFEKWIEERYPQLLIHFQEIKEKVL